MKIISLLKKTILFLFVLLAFSCKPRKELVYYQNIDALKSSEQLNSYEIKIQPDDLLMIIVSADDPETAIPFNLSTISVPSVINNNVMNARGQESMQSYLAPTAAPLIRVLLGSTYTTSFCAK